MEGIRVQNSIDTQYRELLQTMDPSYMEVYSQVENPKLKAVFSTLHSQLINTLKVMNERLPSGEYGSHFWADPSRTLIDVIDRIRSLQRGLSQSEFAFEIDQYYDELLKSCDKFLVRSGGSTIPPNMAKIELYYSIPIFLPQYVVKVPIIENRGYVLRNIGEGSYAIVFRYHDDYYDRDFVVKRAKKDLTEKELARFHREFDQMKALKSPYIVEVYSYNENAGEYTMESMDCTLATYIEKNNAHLGVTERKLLVNQLFRAFSYLHAKDLLHRDISPNNVLLKIYDDLIVLKVADFGLVKLPESSLTSATTELKGCFNDPGLALDGFQNYQIEHETYALARLVYFIMTGRTNVKKDGSSLYVFLENGINPDKKHRFHSVEEMKEAFKKI